MMKKSFIKYKVQPKDSLSSIAFRMNMNEQELREFHNQNCEKIDRLWFDHLNGVQFILVPTLYISPKEKEEQLQKKFPSSINDLYSFHAREYNVSEIFERPDKKPLHLNYRVYIALEEKEKQIIARVSQKDFTKNNEIPEDKITSIALVCMNAISPIPFIISPKGQIQSLYHYKSLPEKFKNKRTAIEDFFAGKASEAYIELFEENISNEAYFFKQIQATFLYQVLFPKIDWFHKKSRWKEKFTIYINSLPIVFDLKAEYHYDNGEFAETIITGKVGEDITLQKLIRKSDEKSTSEDYITTDFYLHYFTDTVTKQISEISSSLNIKYKNELFQKYDLYLKTQ